MEFLIILGLIVLNGIFSMSEIAVISSRKSKLKNNAKQGNKSAQTALNLSENPNRFLSTVQVGITLIGILTGMYSGDVLATKVLPYVENWGMSAAYAYPVTKVTLLILVTYLTIVFGELVPKRLGLSSSEQIATIMAQPMHILSKITYPFVWILSKSTGLVSKLLRIKEQNDKVTEEEIKTMIREGAEGGEVQQMEQNIMERVFNLGDRDLDTIMTPRPDVVWLEKNMSKEEIRDLIKKNPFSKYPVGLSDLDHIEGVVSLKDIFNHIDLPNFELENIMHPAHYFYENKEVYSALEQMKINQDYYGIITDEFGTLSGIVTLKDIMEAIIGEMPELNEEPEIVKRKDDSYLVDGQCPFYNFLQYFKLGDLYAKYEYNTLGGLLLDQLGHIPHPGETLEWKNFTIEVLDMDGPRIDKLLVTQKEALS